MNPNGNNNTPDPLSNEVVITDVRTNEFTLAELPVSNFIAFWILVGIGIWLVWILRPRNM